MFCRILPIVIIFFVLVTCFHLFFQIFISKSKKFSIAFLRLLFALYTKRALVMLVSTESYFPMFLHVFSNSKIICFRQSHLSTIRKRTSAKMVSVFPFTLICTLASRYSRFTSLHAYHTRQYRRQTTSLHVKICKLLNPSPTFIKKRLYLMHN